MRQHGMSVVVADRDLLAGGGRDLLPVSVPERYSNRN